MRENAEIKVYLNNDLTLENTIPLMEPLFDNKSFLLEYETKPIYSLEININSK